MKEDSIEENIECIQEFLEYSQDMINDMDYERPVDVTIYQNQINSLEHILSDYKRVLKENEELLQEKINNQKVIALAQNDMLNYQAGFEDGKNRRTSAVQSIIENQQYYIFQKQIEKYEEHIEKLQKENEELKYKYNKALSDVIAGVDLDNTYISKQKVKDKIEELNQKIENEENEKVIIWLHKQRRVLEKLIEKEDK